MNDDLVSKLGVASRAERARPGAKERAITAVLAAAPPVKSSRRAAVATLGGFLLVASVLAGGLFLKRAQDEQAAVALQAREQLAAQKAQVEKAMAELREQTAHVLELERVVASTRDDAERAAAAQQLAEAKSQADLTRRAISGGSHGAASGATRPAKAACSCPPGDPLCSCIP